MGVSDMYGLFFYDYDHYEWESLIAVSKSKEKLADRYVAETNKVNYPLTISETEHGSMSDDEKFHYMIKEVEYL